MVDPDLLHVDAISISPFLDDRAVSLLSGPLYRALGVLGLLIEDSLTSKGQHHDGKRTF